MSRGRDFLSLLKVKKGMDGRKAQGYRKDDNRNTGIGEGFGTRDTETLSNTEFWLELKTCTKGRTVKTVVESVLRRQSGGDELIEREQKVLTIQQDRGKCFSCQ